MARNQFTQGFRVGDEEEGEVGVIHSEQDARIVEWKA